MSSGGLQLLYRISFKLDSLTLKDRCTAETRGRIRIKLPCITIHTHTCRHTGGTCTHRKHKVRSVFFFATFLIMSLKVFWTHSDSLTSLASYSVQSEIFLLAAPFKSPVAPQLESPSENHHIRGRQTFSISQNWTMLACSAVWQMDGMKERTRGATSYMKGLVKIIAPCHLYWAAIITEAE